MIKRISLLVTAAVMAAMMTVVAAPAFAETVCNKERGTWVCTETTTVEGKNAKQDKFDTTTTTTTTTQGNQENFSPEPQGTGEETDTDPCDPCPPGQYK